MLFISDMKAPAGSNVPSNSAREEDTMRSQLVKGIAVVVTAAFLMSCQSAANNPKTTVGAMGGAAAGGLIGSAAGGGSAGIAAGVILGGLLGGAVGNALDQRDKELAMKQAQMSLETGRTGQSGGWQNPDSGNSGTFTPTRTYQQPNGQYCREYTQQIVVGGEKKQSYGTACRQPDGTWQVQ
jgi:surface antigen